MSPVISVATAPAAQDRLSSANRRNAPEFGTEILTGVFRVRSG